MYPSYSHSKAWACDIYIRGYLESNLRSRFLIYLFVHIFMEGSLHFDEETIFRLTQEYIFPLT